MGPFCWSSDGAAQLRSRDVDDSTRVSIPSGGPDGTDSEVQST